MRDALRRASSGGQPRDDTAHGAAGRAAETPADGTYLEERVPHTRYAG